MASTASKSEGTPTPTAFSYAQAAKGRAASTATSAMQSSQASTSGVSTPAKEPNSLTNTPSASVNGTAVSENGDRVTNGHSDAINKDDPLGVGIDVDTKPTSEVNGNSIPVSPSVGTASTSTIPKEEELTLNGSATAPESVWEKGSRNQGDKPAEAGEGRRNKKSKKQKNAEKDAEKDKEQEKEEVKPEVLVPAPPPAVNFWEQRKEAQAAKTKSSPSMPQTANAFGEASSPTSGTKATDSRRKGKTDDEKVTGGAAGSKDAAVPNKGQKKGTDGLTKGKDDSTKRPARGSRTGEKEEKTAASPLPPPVNDSMAWPTPETALEEEKRKQQEKDKAEKEEKEETASNKPRTKEKWVPVPYTPSVTFNTPLPARGGRGRGGARVGREGSGRGNHASTNGATTGEKTNGASTRPGDSGESNEKRGRGESGVRSSSLPPNASKRLGSDEPSTRDPRKPMVTPGSEKARSNVNKNDAVSPTDVRRTSIATHTDRDAQQPTKGQGQGAFEGQLPAKGFGDRRNDNSRSSEHFKDGGKEPRERAEGRPDRGRGGYRGRGSHNFSSGQHPHAFSNGHGSAAPNGYQGRQNSGPYSPPPQGPFNHGYSQVPNRGGRGSSRSQSIPNANMYSRGFANGNQSMAPLQTMYDYVPVQTMSAIPFNYVEPPSLTVLSMVKMQLEYYFSIDNLCKDVYLRKHMDSQGFVFLLFVAKFKRIQSLTQDIELLRYACQQSSAIELIKGEDGVDRIRRVDGWEQWVLPAEERDESMKNNSGPTTLIRDSPLSPSHLGQMMMPGQELGSPGFAPNGNETAFRYGNGVVPPPAVNGNGNHYPAETPLSAAVPDFAPGLMPLNGATLSMPDPLESETTFTDEEVENLNLVFAQAAQKSNDSKPPKVPYHTSASRTFSNGSIDGRSITEELYESERQGRAQVNGNHANER
ncbi:La domain family protein [Rutstroemia sp. NJR-2017a BVV2]|nr:La domain family protein [Rutstroemia sp. NJR-2017a BVV2]